VLKFAHFVEAPKRYFGQLNSSLAIERFDRGIGGRLFFPDRICKISDCFFDQGKLYRDLGHAIFDLGNLIGHLPIAVQYTEIVDAGF
jgi:hypothetical protein